MEDALIVKLDEIQLSIHKLDKDLEVLTTRNEAEHTQMLQLIGADASDHQELKSRVNASEKSVEEIKISLAKSEQEQKTSRRKDKTLFSVVGILIALVEIFILFLMFMK